MILLHFSGGNALIGEVEIGAQNKVRFVSVWAALLRFMPFENRDYRILYAIREKVSAELAVTKELLKVVIWSFGGGENVAKTHGLPVRRYRICAFPLAGVMASVSAILVDLCTAVAGLTLMEASHSIALQLLSPVAPALLTGSAGLVEFPTRR